jgi:serine/threonine-protein kinase
LDGLQLKRRRVIRVAGDGGSFCTICGQPSSDGRCPNCMTASTRAANSIDGPVAVSDPSRALDALAGTMGGFPRILLADTAGGQEPTVVSTSSTDIPPPADRGVRVQILGEIARGGMGVVLKGRDPDIGRDLAVKVLLESHKENPDLLRRFVEEAQIGGQLQHPGVVPIYELGAFLDGRPFFTMKLVKGQTLSELLAARKSPADDLSRFLAIFEQMCQTMAYAHARDVIHRDLKPSNVMVGSFGEVQVMDWGLAKVLRKGGAAADAAAGRRPPNQTVIAARLPTDSDLSQAGSVLGTPAYMAPEQARGELEEVDERADVFALGSILCEILTGQPAFVGRKAGELHRKAALGDLADARARLEASSADAELLSLARDCLAAEAEDRPRDAGALAQRMIAYRANVEQKLRAAEIARATEEARAEEEAKRRVLADELAREAQARAEESRRAAETAEARAKAESRARRMTGALAAAILLFVLAAAGGYAFFQRQRALRHSQVDSALRDAELLRDEAQRSGDDIARWRAAREAAHSVERLLADARDLLTRNRVTALVDSVNSASRSAENDHELIDTLVEIRSSSEDDPDWSRTDERYATAFRKAEIDIASLTSQEAASRIKTRPASVALAIGSALDDWAKARDKRKDRQGALQLAQAARAADPDPWRNRLRDTLRAEEGQQQLDSLRELARSAKVEDLPAWSLELLGSALTDSGDPKLAETILRNAQRRHPDDVWLNYELAECLEKLARNAEAVRFYMAARSIRPEVAHQLAHALAGIGENDEAIAVFQELTRLRPGIGRHFRCLGELLHRTGHQKEAAAVIETAIGTLRKELLERPSEARLAFNLANMLAFIEKHEESAAVLRKALLANPDDATLHEGLGRSLQSLGKRDAAMEEFRVSIRLKPDYANAHSSLAVALEDKNELAEAESEYRKAIALEPGIHGTYESLGFVLEKLKRPAEALVEYRKAGKIDPNCAAVHRLCGSALQSLGKNDEALAEYRTAFRRSPSEIYYYEQILRGQGRIDELLAEYRELCRLHPNNAAPHNGLAWNIALDPSRPQREYEEALEHSRLAVKLEPENGDYINTLALAEFRVGHWDESLSAARRSISLQNGGAASDWFFLALAFAMKGDKDESRKWFDKAVAHTKEKDPKNRELHQFWKEAAALLGEAAPPELPPAKPPIPFEP